MRDDDTIILPEDVQKLFWECAFADSEPQVNRGAVIGRVLISGGLNEIKWLRQEVGDRAITDWIISHEGRGLSPRQLRFWQLMLDLPEEPLNKWIAEYKASVWGRRLSK